MKDIQPSSIYLKDYLPPAYLIDHAELWFDLFDQGAKVKSRLQIRRNPEAQGQPRVLRLDGVELELRHIGIDGARLDTQQYEFVEEGIRIPGVPDEFVLEVETWIKPQENTCLEGLYRSSDMFCTQCEAEGFRRITYFIDRPDVMCRFRTTITADQGQYPVLLSNGNPIGSGVLAQGRHFVTWDDPFRKPCYLFALVAGDLSCVEDEFVTQSGRKVALRMFVEPKNSDKCAHGLTSLKKSMQWDEEVYGREYDLDIFMIVAVDHFNMGAMENKGLNIFNSSCVLAKPEAATDSAYQRIEAIVAHEYFHNWSGNRVTCRDWFQLSLKEGFTVFRDSEFSADVNSRTVKRIEDVNLLRTSQFAEDAGPMSHPVRPASYMEISNFYTLTVYEKGAEVVRMIHTLLGAEKFRKGSDLYFERHDGQAVTTDDFVAAMQDASGIDLTQFKRWYDQGGTPVVSVSSEFDQKQGVFTLHIKQSCPPTPGQPEKLPFHIPFAFGLLDDQGRDLPLFLSEDAFRNSTGEASTTCILNLTETEQSFSFYGVTKCPTPSLLRNFSAPVRLRYEYSPEQLRFLMANDSDGFNRWDAGQRLAVSTLQSLVGDIQAGRECLLEPGLVDAYRALLRDETLDPALLAKMLTLPSENYLIELADVADVDAIHFAREFVRNELTQALRSELAELYRVNNTRKPYQPSADDIAQRALKNTALNLLLGAGDETALDWAKAQFAEANNMTDRSAALVAIVNSPFSGEADAALTSFYDDWKTDVQVIEQWLAIQAGSHAYGSLDKVQQLLDHEAFDMGNPNKVRSVIGVFCNQNIAHFHQPDGAGYAFLADKILYLNQRNPQIASRLATPLIRWRKYGENRQQLMKAQLQRILASADLSKDVYEVVAKALKN